MSDKNLNKNKPELLWLPIKDLFVDKAYQRESDSRASRNNVEYMTENFSWGLCGAIIVFKVKNKFAIVDGQHRVEAAKANGIKEMPCVVVSDEDVKRQAKSFVLINTKRVQLHPLAAFRAAVAAGDEKANELSSLLKVANIEIPVSAPQNGMTGPRQTMAVGSLLKMIDQYDHDIIVMGLNIIADAYGDQLGKMRAMFIKAIVEFLFREPDILTGPAHTQQFINVVRDINPRELELEGRSVVKLQGGRLIEVMINAIERKYRRDARSTSKLVPFIEDQVAAAGLVSPAPVLVKHNKEFDNALDSSKTYNAAEVAKELGIEEDDISRLVRRGKLGAPDLGDNWTRAQIDKYLAIRASAQAGRNKKVSFM